MEQSIMTRQTDPKTKTKTLTLEDLERLQISDPESDPDHIFQDPETETGSPRRQTLDLGDQDPETISLFWKYGAKINRLAKSDPRLSGLRV